MLELTRWSRNPWSVFDELEALHRDFTRTMNELGGNRGRETRQAVFPPMNIWVSSEGIIADVELPGMDPKDVQVSVSNDELTISGKREEEAIPEGAVIHRRERDLCEFSRSIRLPFRANANAVKASFKNGVLRVNVPRAEDDKPRKITVESA